jgi:succinate dehydrogenase/fumarate reductase-like Fe-S protein
MTQEELNELLEQVEEEFRIFERPSANNSRKMMKFLQEAVKNNGVLPLVIDTVCPNCGSDNIAVTGKHHEMCLECGEHF